MCDKRMRAWAAGLISIFAVLLLTVPCMAAGGAASLFDKEIQETEDSLGQEPVADPLEPINRAFFAFNDKLYFWLLKPVATAYSTVLAEDVRMCVRNVFHNLLTPVRVVNNLLQGKISNAGIELARAVINTTVGAAGLGDPAASEFNLRPREEDLGQTLGTYGIGNGIYFCWPFLGPSTLRDTVGMIGDGLLNPVPYLAGDFSGALAAASGERVNNVSLRLGEYEDFKAAALDPYVSLRDAYYQYRKARIEDRDREKPALTDARNSDQGAGGDDWKKDVKLQAAVDSPSRCFSVHVGMCLDEEQVAVISRKLQEISLEAVVRVHERGDYRFYGVETPVTGTFAEAKEKEIILASQGFPNAMVVAQ